MTELSKQPSVRTAGFQLLIVSFVVLFQELALIRWLPAQVRVLAYFPNLVLISAFLGLGVGSLRSRARSLLPFWPPSLLALVASAYGLSHIAFTQESATEHLWLLYYDLGDQAPVVDGVRLPIIILFVLSALSFVPLGQFVASRLSLFQQRSSALWGYSWDLSGSLMGAILFATISFWRTFPVVWFAVILVLGSVPFVRRRSLWLHLGSGIALLLLIGAAERAEIYSPYYALDVEVTEEGPVRISANGSLHQVATPLKSSDPDNSTRTRSGYHDPYRRLQQAPGKVLILGAGSGNDVAVALDEGAQRVDAVEIDPAIIDIGRRHHPNRPYSSNRVRLINTDARSFLNDTEETYDLIVFGTLDSMTRLSALSNVRLDNFVYTRQCLEAAKNRLSPDGGMLLYFMVGRPFIHHHLLGLLTEVFGELPAVVDRHHGLFNRVYLAGPAFAHVQRKEREEALSEFQTIYALALDLPSDDWPYLYLEGRGISGFYLSLMAVFLAIAFAMVLASSREMRSSFRTGPDYEMFLFGLAFLLIETKFITEMSLVWGATWITSAVVFGSILLMVLLATLLMQLKPISWRGAASGLIVALAINYLLPTQMLLGRHVAIKLALSILFVGAPVFFASACFALRFRRRARVDLAFGWNLLGAVAGGLLEFTSMAVGIKALSLVGIAAYLGAFFLRERDLAGGREAKLEPAPMPE